MISETQNMELVNSILHDPKIWSEIAGDLDKFDLDYDPSCRYFVMNEVDGVIIFNTFKDGVEIHPSIVPNKRGKLAYEAVEESIQRIFDAGHANIYCEIDPCLRHVIMFARALGFKRIERNDRDLFVRFRLDS